MRTLQRYEVYKALGAAPIVTVEADGVDVKDGALFLVEDGVVKAVFSSKEWSHCWLVKPSIADRMAKVDA